MTKELLRECVRGILAEAEAWDPVENNPFASAAVLIDALQAIGATQEVIDADVPNMQVSVINSRAADLEGFEEVPHILTLLNSKMGFRDKVLQLCNDAEWNKDILETLPMA